MVINEPRAGSDTRGRSEEWTGWWCSGAAAPARALRRGRERIDFWRWVIGYRRRWRPAVLAAVREHAPGAELVVLRTPRAVRAWV